MEIVNNLFLNCSSISFTVCNACFVFLGGNRLEKLYVGSKVYVGLQIPDPDSGSRKNIDLVLVTKQ